MLKARSQATSFQLLFFFCRTLVDAINFAVSIREMRVDVNFLESKKKITKDSYFVITMQFFSNFAEHTT